MVDQKWIILSSVKDDLQKGYNAVCCLLNVAPAVEGELGPRLASLALELSNVLAAIETALAPTWEEMALGN